MYTYEDEMEYVMSQMDSNDFKEINALIRKGRVIYAIKILRGRYNCGLKVSKEIVYNIKNGKLLTSILPNELFEIK